MEYVYKLNLPNISSIIEESKFNDIFTKNHVTIFNAQDFLKPEWKTFRGYTWKCFFSFYKPNGLTTNIHSDTESAVYNNSTLNCWAINWIVNGQGIMEYWDKSGIKLLYYHKQTTPTGPYTVPCYNAIAKPIKKYELKEGVYLVNIGNVHRATGLQNRHAFSFRAHYVEGLTWETVVKEFNDLIIS